MRCSLSCSPSTHRNKIKIKRRSGLGRGRRGKEGERKNKWINQSVYHLGKVGVVHQRVQNQREKKDERKRKNQRHGRLERERREAKPPLDHKNKNVKQKIPHRKLGAALLSSPRVTCPLISNP